MRVLAIDASGVRGGLAITADGATESAVELGPPGTHAGRILVELDDLLHRLSLAPADIDLVVVSKGPGSFTGIRIGMAAATGFAFGIGKPVVGVTSLEILAAWAATVDESDDRVCAGIVDARRGEVYAGAWRVTGSLTETVVPPAAVKPGELERLLEPAFGRSADRPLLLCGDGVAVAAAEIAGWKAPVKTVFPPLGADGATLLARLGEARYHRDGASPDLEPLYVRQADARKPGSILKS